MSALLYVRVTPWQLAALFAIGFNVLSGCAAIEVRRNRLKPLSALFAVMCADTAMLFTIPSLSPALVTTISGISMVTIIWLLSPESPPTSTRVAATCVAAAIIIIAIDLHVSDESLPTVPTSTQQAAYWVSMGICAALTAVGAVYSDTESCPKSVKIALIAGKGITAATNTALVYTIMNGGQAVLIPVLLCSAIFDLYVLRKSLAVNTISVHLPIEFCIYQFVVWLSSPAIAAMTYHGGAGAAIGTIIAVIGATIILAAAHNDPKNAPA